MSEQSSSVYGQIKASETLFSSEEDFKVVTAV